MGIWGHKICGESKGLVRQGEAERIGVLQRRSHKFRDYRGVGGCGDAEPGRGRDTELSAARDIFSSFCREKERRR